MESAGDAAIEHQGRSSDWTVQAGGASISFTIGRAAAYSVTAIVSPSGANWVPSSGPDAVITVDGVPHRFGSGSDGFVFTSVSTRNDGGRLQLDAAYTLLPQNLLVTRHASVVSGSPTFEVWTTFQALGDSVLLSDLDASQLVIAPGTIHWVTGHQPASGDASLDSSFARRQQTLKVGDTLTFGSAGRSSESTVPWLAIDGANDELYTALLWSGSWSLNLARTSAGLSVAWRLAPLTTAAGSVPVEGPHAIVGIARGSLPDASAALRAFIVDGLRGGRPLKPLVTYNTWFAYGTRVDETSMRREMEREAALGVELFVVDAGWYTGADTHKTNDFTPGLGTWEADPARFPNGLKPLSDYAHDLGMKFGIWVEPERVALSVVGHDGLDETALATSHGQYQSDTSALICLAGRAGRQWVLDRLTRLIDAAQPDYLKWDNNLWLDCDRDGHGHGQTDGSFAHVTALYELLDALRKQYPSLTIENCAAGGNRLDLAMLRYTDVAWMDDHTAPSVRVRHNLDGLSLVFPPAYLLSFLTNLGWEPLHNSPDLALYARSRMPGVPGLSFEAAWLDDDDRSALAGEIALYKTLRSSLSQTAAALLSPQADESGGPDWEALQETSTDGTIVIYVFDNDAGGGGTLVFPANLQPATTYRVLSADAGPLGAAAGADLMAGGIRVVRSAATGAHVLSLVPEP